VRGEAIDDDDAENKMGDESKSTKKKTDFYDPSILASPSSATSDQLQEEQNRLLFEEVIDLARGGIGGQFTRTLKRKKKRRKKKKGQSRSKRKKKKDHSKSMKIHNPPQRRMRRKRKRLNDDKDDEREKQCAKRRLVARSGSLNTLPVSPQRPKREKEHNKQSRIINVPPPPPQRKKRKMMCVTKRSAHKSMYSALGSIPPPRQSEQTQLVLEDDNSITPRTVNSTSRKSSRRLRERERGREREGECNKSKGATKCDGSSQETKETPLHPIKRPNGKGHDVENQRSCDLSKSKGDTDTDTDTDGDDKRSSRSIAVSSVVISKGKRLWTKNEQSDRSGSVGRTVDMKLKCRKKAEKRRRTRKGKGQQNSLCALFNK